MKKEDILQLDRIEEYREGNQLEAKAAQGGLPDTLWDSYSAFANTVEKPSVFAPRGQAMLTLTGKI